MSTTQLDAPGTRGRGAAMRRRESSSAPSSPTPVAYAYLLPLMIIVAAFMLYPLVASILLSVLNPRDEFVGLNNFQRVLSGVRFSQNIVVTIVYSLVVVSASMVIGVLAAHLVTARSRVINFLRPIYLIPWVIPAVASSIMFRSILDGQAGPVPTMIQAITGAPFYPLADFTWSVWFVILHEVWRCFPFVMLFLAAGLTTIHPSIHEAATIDGASRMQRFWFITLPMLRPHIFVVALMVTNFSLQSAESIYSMTQGGPGYATETLGVRIFKTAFVDSHVNTAAVLGVLMLLIAVVLMLIYGRLLKPEESLADE